MAGRTPAEAVHSYIEPLQRAVDCICRGVLGVDGGYYPRPDPHILSLDRGDPVRLDGDKPVWISITQHYRIIEDPDAGNRLWKVRPVAYYYMLQENDEREIMAYHWHPLAPGTPAFPHFHLYEGSGVQHTALQKAHLPTSYVALEDVIRLVIREFGVRVRRDDWEAVLDASQAASPQ